LHAHAVLMGSFLLVLLLQTWLMATGRSAQHKQVGMLAIVLAAALVIVGIILVPTMYQMRWDFAQAAPAGVREQLLAKLSVVEDVLLPQIRQGVLFPLFLLIGLNARGQDAGLHKRMMFLATAMLLTAGIDRITWLPSTMPSSPTGGEVYILLAILPMFLWD